MEPERTCGKDSELPIVCFAERTDLDELEQVLGCSWLHEHEKEARDDPSFVKNNCPYYGLVTAPDESGAAKKPAADPQIISVFYNLEITLLEAMLGTVPKNKDIYAAYIASKQPGKEKEIETVEDVEESGWTGFHVDGDGPFLLNYQVKGFIKEAGNTLKDQLKIKALKAKLDRFLFIFPRKIRLPEIEPEPLERPLRALTAKGERVTLIRSDQIAAGTVLECQIELLKHKEINEGILRCLLSYGARKGLGQFRNGGYGSFTYTLTKVVRD